MKMTFTCLMLLFSITGHSFAQQPGSGNASTIFLGDSMLYGFTNFPEYLPSAVTNLTITASKSSSVVQTVNTAVQYNPANIFIMTGINDVSDGDIAGFTRNYSTILDTVATKSPGSRVYAQALFPVNWNSFPALYNIGNGTIDAYNAAIESVSATHANTTFLDFGPYFTDASGNLKAELSKDGLHLNVEGYKLWGSLLAPYF